MRILFDNGTPQPIAKSLQGHQVTLSRNLGWQELRNGDLIAKAEAAGFDLLLTTDKNIRHQQNLSGRNLIIVVLGNSQWPMVRQHLSRIAAAVDAATPGSYTEVQIPFR